jgi:hypothetical protein
MTPEKLALLRLGVFITQQLLQLAPELFLRLKETISKKDVTVEELQALLYEVEGDAYSKLVPNTKIPPEQRTP